MTGGDDEARAAEIALGVLDPRAEAVAKARLAQDPALVRAVAEAERRLARLAAAAPPVTPPPALLEQILQRVRAEKPGELAGTITVRADEGRWRQVAPGVTIKLLWREPASGRQAMLVRCAAGATFAGHAHDLDEETLVLEGEISCAGLSLQAGDYHLARAGTEHPPAFSATGCLLYLSAR
jgi:anti-sigma-K factor RskA